MCPSAELIPAPVCCSSPAFLESSSSLYSMAKLLSLLLLDGALFQLSVLMVGPLPVLEGLS